MATNTGNVGIGTRLYEYGRVAPFIAPSIDNDDLAEYKFDAPIVEESPIEATKETNEPSNWSFSIDTSKINEKLGEKSEEAKEYESLFGAWDRTMDRITSFFNKRDETAISDYRGDLIYNYEPKQRELQSELQYLQGLMELEENPNLEQEDPERYQAVVDYLNDNSETYNERVRERTKVESPEISGYMWNNPAFNNGYLGDPSTINYEKYISRNPRDRYNEVLDEATMVGMSVDNLSASIEDKQQDLNDRITGNALILNHTVSDEYKELEENTPDDLANMDYWLYKVPGMLGSTASLMEYQLAGIGGAFAANLARTQALRVAANSTLNPAIAASGNAAAGVFAILGTAATVASSIASREHESYAEIFDAYKQSMTAMMSEPNEDGITPYELAVAEGREQLASTGNEQYANATDEEVFDLLLTGVIQSRDPRFAEYIKAGRKGLDQMFQQNMALAAVDVAQQAIALPFVGKVMKGASQAIFGRAATNLGSKYSINALRTMASTRKRLAPVINTANKAIDNIIDYGTRLAPRLVNPSSNLRAFGRTAGNIGWRVGTTMLSEGLIDEGNQYIISQNYLKGLTRENPTILSSLWDDVTYTFEGLKAITGIGDSIVSNDADYMAAFVGGAAVGGLLGGGPVTLSQTGLGRAIPGMRGEGNLFDQIKANNFIRELTVDQLLDAENLSKARIYAQQAASKRSGEIVQSLEWLKNNLPEGVTTQDIDNEIKRAERTMQIANTKATNVITRDMNISKDSDDFFTFVGLANHTVEKLNNEKVANEDLHRKYASIDTDLKLREYVDNIIDGDVILKDNIYHILRFNTERNALNQLISEVEQNLDNATELKSMVGDWVDTKSIKGYLEALRNHSKEMDANAAKMTEDLKANESNITIDDFSGFEGETGDRLTKLAQEVILSDISLANASDIASRFNGMVDGVPYTKLDDKGKEDLRNFISGYISKYNQTVVDTELMKASINAEDTDTEVEISHIPDGEIPVVSTTDETQPEEPVGTDTKDVATATTEEDPLASLLSSTADLDEVETNTFDDPNPQQSTFSLGDLLGSTVDIDEAQTSPFLSGDDVQSLANAPNINIADLLGSTSDLMPGVDLEGIHPNVDEIVNPDLQQAQTLIQPEIVPEIAQPQELLNDTQLNQQNSLEKISEMNADQKNALLDTGAIPSDVIPNAGNDSIYGKTSHTFFYRYDSDIPMTLDGSATVLENGQELSKLLSNPNLNSKIEWELQVSRFNPKDPSTYDQAAILLIGRHDGKTYGSAIKTPEGATILYSGLQKQNPEKIAKDLEQLKNFRRKVIESWIQAQQQGVKLVPTNVSISNGRFNSNRTTDENGVSRVVNRPIRDIKGFNIPEDLDAIDKGNVRIGIGKGVIDGNIIFDQNYQLLPGKGGSGRIFIYPQTPSGKDTPIQLNERRFGNTPADNQLIDLIFNLLVYYRANNVDQIQVNHNGKRVPSGFTAEQLLKVIINHGPKTIVRSEERDKLSFLLPKQLNFDQQTQTLQVGDNKYNRNELLNNPELASQVKEQIRNNFHWTMDKDMVWDRIDTTIDAKSFFRSYDAERMVIVPGLLEFTYEDVGLLKTDTGRFVRNEDMPNGRSWLSWYANNGILLSDLQDQLFKDPFVYVDDVKLEDYEETVIPETNLENNDNVIPQPDGSITITNGGKGTINSDDLANMSIDEILNAATAGDIDTSGTPDTSDWTKRLGVPKVYKGTSIVTNTIDIDRARKNLNDMLGLTNEDIVITDKIIELGHDVQAAGLMRENAIILWEGAQPGVEYHEAFHRVSQFLLEPVELNLLYNSYRRMVGNMELSDTIVEENLADGFMEYAQSPLARLTYQIKKAYNKILKFVGAYSLMTDTSILDLYSNIYNGVYKNVPYNPEAVERFRNTYSDSQVAFTINTENGDVGFDHFPTLSDVYDAVGSLKQLLFSITDTKTVNDIDNLRGSKGALKMALIREISNVERNIEQRKAIAEIAKNFETIFWPMLTSELEAMGLREVNQLDDQRNESIEAGGTASGEITWSDKMAMELSKKDNALLSVKLFMGTMPRTEWVYRNNPDGTQTKVLDFVYNDITGFPMPVDFDTSWNIILENLYSIDTKTELMNKLGKLNDNPFFATLANRLNDGSVDENLETQIIQTISSNKQQLFYVSYGSQLVDGETQTKVGFRVGDSNTLRAMRLYPTVWNNNLYNSSGIIKKTAGAGISVDSTLLSNIIGKFNRLTTAITNGYEAKNITDLQLIDYKKDLVSILGEIGINVDVDTIDTMILNTDNLAAYNNVGQFYRFLTNVHAKSISKLFNNTLSTIANGKAPTVMRGSKRVNINYDEIYKYESFVKALAEAYSLVHPRPEEMSVLGPNGNLLYPITEHNYVSNLVGRLNKPNPEGQKYNDLITKLSSVTYNGSSLVLSNLRSKNKIKLNTFANFVEESAGDRGRDYLGISSAEDYLMKMALVENDHLLFPTMADRRVYNTITGIKLPHTRLSIARDGNMQSVMLDNKVLSIFNDYIQDEWNTIKEYYSPQHQEILRTNPERKVKNYHSKNRGGRFRYFTGVWLNVNGVPEFTDLNQLLDEYENGKVPGATVYTALDLIDSQFFARDTQFRLGAINDILKMRILDEIETAKKLGIIYTYNRPGSRLPILANRLLDEVKYNELLAYYQKSVDPELSTNAQTYAVLDMISDYTINTIISVQEFGKVFMKDPAFYKNTDDMIKRYGGLLSTGTNLRTEWDPSSDMNGRVSYTTAELTDNIIKSNQFNQLMKIYTDYYKGEGNNETTAKVLAARDIAGYESINQTDATVYISPKMYRDIVRMLGEWNNGIAEAFEVMENNTEWLSNPSQYAVAMRTLMKPLKMTSFNDVFDPGLKLDIPVYDKMALFPMFRVLATGDNRALYERMTGQGIYSNLNPIDMVKTESAVKVGSRSQASFYTTPEMTEVTDLTKLQVYSQLFDNIRRQLNTDPHTEERQLFGTQAAKIALANLDLKQTYSKVGLTGEQIRDEVYGVMNALSNQGALAFKSQIGTVRGNNFIMDNNKLSKLLSKDAKTSKLPFDVIDGLKVINDEFAVPLAAMSSAGWVESRIISMINKNTIDIKLPGGAFIQMSSFGFKSIVPVSDSAINGGKRQLFINDDNSMDTIVSVNLFIHMIPEANRGSFESQKQWLIDNAIIGEGSTTVAMGYRIPTQGNNSTVALRVVDVLPENIGDTIILPDEFTAQTGSDFDIDKLYVARYNYDKEGRRIGFNDNITDNESWTNDFERLVELGFTQEYIDNLQNLQNNMTKTKWDLNSREANENRLLDMYLAVLTDPTKLAETRLPLDNVTNYLKTVVLRNVDGQLTKQKPQPFAEAAPTFQLDKKYEYTTGKNGIAPFALNTVHHVLTQLMNLNFKSSNILQSLGLGSLSGVDSRDDSGIRILDWFSALINAHVDVAKDPYIIRFNIVPWTYDVANMLFRSGIGENTFYFLPQQILKDMAKMVANINGRYGIDSTKSRFKLELDAIDKVYEEYLTKAQILVRTPEQGNLLSNLDSKNDDGTLMTENYHVLNSKEYLLNQLEKGRKNDTKDFDWYYNQLLIYKTYEQIQPYALGLNELVQTSQIDTKKFGNNFLLQKNYLYRIKRNMLTNNVFENDAIRNFYMGSFMDTKIRNSIIMGQDLFKDYILRASDSFITQHDAFMSILGIIDTRDERLINGISNTLEADIKSGFFQSFLSKNNIDPRSYYYGDRSIAMRLLQLKSDIIGGKYPDMLDSSGKIKNDFLNYIEARPGTQQFDGYQSPDFITTNVSTSKDIYLQDKLKRYWNELINSTYPEIRNFAKDLVMFAFLTSGDNGSLNNIFDLVPLDYRTKLGYTKYMKDVMNQANSGVLHVNFDDIFKNNWMNGQIVPDIKFSTSRFDPQVEGFVTTKLPHIESNTVISGTNMKYPILFMNKYSSPIGINAANQVIFKPYVKINLDHTKNPATTILYKYVGNRYDEDRVAPIYVAISKKGLRQDGIVITENNGNIESILDFNNLPGNVLLKLNQDPDIQKEFLSHADISTNDQLNNANNLLQGIEYVSDLNPVDVSRNVTYDEAITGVLDKDGAEVINNNQIVNNPNLMVGIVNNYLTYTTGQTYALSGFEEYLKDQGIAITNELRAIYGAMMVRNHSPEVQQENWNMGIESGDIFEDKDMPGGYTISSLHANAGGQGGHKAAFEQYYKSRYEYGQNILNRYWQYLPMLDKQDPVLSRSRNTNDTSENTTDPTVTTDVEINSQNQTEVTQQPILFNSATYGYSVLSNFADTPITIEGIEYPTAEHAFQAGKVTDNFLKEMFSTKYETTPAQAKQMGRKVELRPDWETVKLDVMKDVLIHKFLQHEGLRTQLLNTGDRQLIHDTSNRQLFKVNDDFWGNGWEKNGQNYMGRLLMEVRNELRNNPTTGTTSTQGVIINEPLVIDSNIIDIQGRKINLSDLGINFKLNIGQIRALNEIMEWYDSTDSMNNPAYALKGAAGTGKSTIMRILAYLLNKDLKIVPVAPTHVAKNVLANYLGKDYAPDGGSTIHGFLGLRLNVNLETFDLNNLQFDTTGKAYEDSNSFIIVDESSMVNDKLADALINKTKDLYGSRILFVGDPDQLNPVNQSNISKVFSDIPASTLEVVERQKSGNPLLSILPLVRDLVETPTNPYPRFNPDFNTFGKGLVLANTYDGGEGFALMQWVAKQFGSPEFKSNPNLIRWLAYRNDIVSMLNGEIRKALGRTELIVEDEVLKAYDRHGNFVENSDEFVVREVSDISDINLTDIYGISDNGKPIKIKGYTLIMSRDYSQSLDEIKNNLTKDIKKQDGESTRITLIASQEERMKLRAVMQIFNQQIEDELDQLYQQVVDGNIGKSTYFKQMRDIQNDRMEKSQMVAVMFPITGNLTRARYLGKGGSTRKQVADWTFMKKTFDYGYAGTTHKCLSENSLVYTKVGLKLLKNIEIGDLVNVGNGIYKPVIDKIKTGTKQLVRITTKNGYSIESSLDHRILNHTFGFCKASEFNIGDYIPIARKTGEINIDINNLSLAWLIGYIVGDGSYNLRKKSKSRIDIAVGKLETDALSNLKQCLEHLNISYHIYIKTGSIQIVIENMGFRQKLLDLGLSYESGKNKTIPHHYIYTNDIQEKSDFLRGLFDADGSAGKGRNIRYVTQCRAIAHTVQKLLLEFGIISYISHRLNAYTIGITGSSYDKYIDFINFSINRKRSRLIKSYRFKSNADIIPEKDKLLNGIKLPNKLRNLRKNKSLNYYQISKLDNMDNRFTNLLEYGYYFDVIDNIEFIGEGNTYDLEIADIHQFVADGFVVHNSQGGTYKYVVINYEDLLLDQDINERMRLIYTAMSRPTDAAILQVRQPVTQGLSFTDYTNTLDKINEEYDSNAANQCRGK